MDPEDLSVLVRRVDALLEVRLVSRGERITFQLLTSQAASATAQLTCGGLEEEVTVLDNGDGTNSITVTPGSQCTVLLQI